MMSDNPLQSFEERLEQEVAGYLSRRLPPGDGPDAVLRARTHREVLGHAIDDVRRLALPYPETLPAAVRCTLRQTPMPDLGWLEHDSRARRFAGHYLSLVARAVILNQTEERIRREFGARLRTQPPYPSHMPSLLAALMVLNGQPATLEAAVRNAGLDAYAPGADYLECVREAIRVADAVYDGERAAAAVAQIEAGEGEGSIPLGVELEFSYLGAKAVRARTGADPYLDSLFYFHDFDLARRLWKLGGHRDDHNGTPFDEGRSRGFLELALGRVQVGEDYACPVTDDVGVLAGLVREAAAYVGIPPHSLHLSIQVDASRPFSPVSDPEPLLCLLLLGGDLGLDAGGVLRERRIFGREVTGPYGRLQFSRLKAHRTHAGDQQPARVVEFTFPRLHVGRCYEPLILALKGFQWAGNPSPLDPAVGASCRRGIREAAEALRVWAEAPQPVSRAGIDAFLECVERGLDAERRLGRGHAPAYAARVLGQIEGLLHAANQQIRDHAGKRQPLPAARPEATESRTRAHTSTG